MEDAINNLKEKNLDLDSNEIEERINSKLAKTVVE